MKTILFVHSAGSQGPGEGSYGLVSSLRSSLGETYRVLYPIMPHPEDPDYEPWKNQLKEEFSNIGGEVILIGHSVGGSTILKFLTEEKITHAIKGLFLVAAPFWGKDADWQYEPFTLPEGFESKLPAIPKIFFYHSRGDEIVPYTHAMWYGEKLPQATIREISGNDHAFAAGLEVLVKDIKGLE